MEIFKCDIFIFRQNKFFMFARTSRICKALFQNKYLYFFLTKTSLYGIS